LVALACCAPDAQAAGRVFEEPRGVWNREVTQNNIQDTICVPGWTKTVRPPVSYTNAVKRLLWVDEASARECVVKTHAGYDASDDAAAWTQAVNDCAGQLHATKAELSDEDAEHLAQYELDHKFPLTGGGHPYDIRNLWLQPWSCKKQETAAPDFECVGNESEAAEVKDKVEVKLNRAICVDGRPLRSAQREFAKGWKQFGAQQ
jgi:hypothetical protein